MNTLCFESVIALWLVSSHWWMTKELGKTRRGAFEKWIPCSLVWKQSIFGIPKPAGGGSRHFVGLLIYPKNPQLDILQFYGGYPFWIGKQIRRFRIDRSIIGRLFPHFLELNTLEKKRGWGQKLFLTTPFCNQSGINRRTIWVFSGLVRAWLAGKRLNIGWVWKFQV